MAVLGHAALVVHLGAGVVVLRAVLIGPAVRAVTAQAVPVVAGCGEVGRSDVRLVLELPRLRRLPLQSGDAPLQLADPLLSAAEVLAQPGRQGEGFPRSWLVPSRP